jgi:hypothetical protein
MIGGAIGLAVLASVALLRTGGLLAAGETEEVALNEGYHAAFLAAAVLSIGTALLVGTQVQNPSQPAPSEEPVPEAPREEERVLELV